MQIVEVGTDGNCLFRAVAFQIYGDEDLCHFLREKCMEYVLACGDYFKDFIDRDVHGSIENYCAHKG